MGGGEVTAGIGLRTRDGQRQLLGVFCGRRQGAVCTCMHPWPGRSGKYPDTCNRPESTPGRCLTARSLQLVCHAGWFAPITLRHIAAQNYHGAPDTALRNGAKLQQGPIHAVKPMQRPRSQLCCPLGRNRLDMGARLPKESPQKLMHKWVALLPPIPLMMRRAWRRRQERLRQRMQAHPVS